MVFTLQVRNQDGSFWLAEPEVHVHSHDLPGSTGPTGYQLELLRYPEEWDHEVTLEPGWSLSHFRSSTFFPNAYDGALSSPAQKNIPFTIYVIREDEEWGEIAWPFLQGWAWDMERL